MSIVIVIKSVLFYPLPSKEAMSNTYTLQRIRIHTLVYIHTYTYNITEFEENYTPLDIQRVDP